MDIARLYDYLDYLSKPQHALGDFPICPYLKKYIDNIEIRWVGDFKNELLKIYDKWPLDKKIVLLISDDLQTHTSQLLDQLVIEKQEQFNTKNLWLAFDHANVNNYINGVKTNNDQFAILLVQILDETVRLSDSLHKTNYYSYWSNKYYKEIVTARKDLISGNL